MARGCLFEQREIMRQELARRDRQLCELNKEIDILIRELVKLTKVSVPAVEAAAFSWLPWSMDSAFAEPFMAGS